MKNLHHGHCLIGVAGAVVLLVVLGVEAGTLGVLALALACPLMMLVMMRMMVGDRTSTRREDHPADHGQTR